MTEIITPVKKRDKIERLTQRERLGELLLRHRILNFQQLLDVMEEFKKTKGCPLGELLVKKSLVTPKQLIDLLKEQKAQDKVIDNCLEELGLMTNAQKWEKLTRHNKIGEILVQRQELKFSNLIKALQEQEQNYPEQLLGEILVEKKLIDSGTLRNAMHIQQNQIHTLIKTVQEMMHVAQVPIRVKLLQMNTFMF